MNKLNFDIYGCAKNISILNLFLYFVRSIIIDMYLDVYKTEKKK